MRGGAQYHWYYYSQPQHACPLSARIVMGVLMVQKKADPRGRVGSMGLDEKHGGYLHSCDTSHSPLQLEHLRCLVVARVRFFAPSVRKLSVAARLKFITEVLGLVPEDIERAKVDRAEDFLFTRDFLERQRQRDPGGLYDIVLLEGSDLVPKSWDSVVPGADMKGVEYVVFSVVSHGSRSPCCNASVRPPSFQICFC